MGKRFGICGFQNTGKSFSRRFIPDGENVVIIQPSVKMSHLYQSFQGVEKMDNQQISNLIRSGKRKLVQNFDLNDPEKKYKNILELYSKIPDLNLRNIGYILRQIQSIRTPSYYGKSNEEKRKFITGNVILCENLSDLVVILQFVNDYMPWVHTVILPDFTHFITETITSFEFRSRKKDGEQYSKYLDLASDSLRSFVKSSDRLRDELVVVTEYHAVYDEHDGTTRLFTPGGKMFTEKFLPASYYDTLFFTNVKYDDVDKEAKPWYQYITRSTEQFPEARSLADYDDLYIENNLQAALTDFRNYYGIPLS